MKKRWIIITTVIIAILLLSQLIPVTRSNPPVSGEILTPVEISAILRKSCYDCHSHQTNWPWYSRIAPVSWLVIHDVEEGRDHLNFSTWNNYNSREKIKIYEEMREVLEKEEMPLKPYLWMHSEAKLSQKDLKNLFQWLNLSTGDTL
jgi:hypothetical protein